MSIDIKINYCPKVFVGWRKWFIDLWRNKTVLDDMYGVRLFGIQVMVLAERDKTL